VPVWVNDPRYQLSAGSREGIQLSLVACEGKQKDQRVERLRRGEILFLMGGVSGKGVGSVC